MFVESYGRVAVEDSWFAPQVDRTLTGSTAQLAGSASTRAAAGSARPPSAASAGWRTRRCRPGCGSTPSSATTRCSAATGSPSPRRSRRPGGAPSATSRPTGTPGPRASAFYRYQRMYDSCDVGYVGPRFSYARVPDQYTMRAFDDRELRTHRRPVMAEIDLDSSHTPWTSLPRLRAVGLPRRRRRSTTACTAPASPTTPRCSRRSPTPTPSRATTPARSATRCGPWSRSCSTPTTRTS